MLAQLFRPPISSFRRSPILQCHLTTWSKTANSDSPDFLWAAARICTFENKISDCKSICVVLKCDDKTMLTPNLLQEKEAHKTLQRFAALWCLIEDQRDDTSTTKKQGCKEWNSFCKTWKVWLCLKSKTDDRHKKGGGGVKMRWWFWQKCWDYGWFEGNVEIMTEMLRLWLIWSKCWDYDGNVEVMKEMEVYRRWTLDNYTGWPLAPGPWGQ